MTDLPPGSILKSRYKILEQLGQGGMGEVYLAEDQSLANQVAVKANHNLSAHYSAQFIREARLLASLKHPNLPRVIDYFTEEESQYLVMDYIPGDDLRKLVENKNAISISLVLKWAEQLGNALNYLHTQNPPIYHRDVKPANIKLTPTGEVVLVDFGIAKTGDPSQETQTGAWGYTPGFAPPEQVSGLRTGPYSDQFSLAATLYYLMAGKAPADSAQRMMGSEELVPIKDIKPEVPEHVSNAVQRAMSIKPEARFATISDFVSAITSAVPVPEPSSTQKTVIGRAHSIPPPPPNTSSPVPQIPQPIKPKKSNAIGWLIGLVVLIGLVGGGFLIFKGKGLLGTPASPTESPSPTIEATTEGMVTDAPAPTIETAVTETLQPTATVTPEPAYIPVGQGGKLAFVSNRQGDGYDQIWLMDVVQDKDGNLLGLNPTQLTFNEGDKSNPAWSPDGTRLLFSGLSSGKAPNGKSFEDDIWLLDMTQPDAEPVDLSQQVRDDKYASWSPDGKWIAYTSFYRDDGLPMLFIMKPDGSEQTKLSDVLGESYATWTANSDFLLYVQTAGFLRILYMRDKFSVYTTTQKFDRRTIEGRLGLVSEPNLSLNGEILAYTRIENSKTNIYIAPFSERGNTITQLTNSGKDSTPVWSPDGQWLVFTTLRDGNSQIYIMTGEGEQVTNLTNSMSQDRDPAWQPLPKTEP